MSDLNQRLIQSSLGENRLHPDQQKAFLGTFRERVILTLSLIDCRSQAFAPCLPKILEHLQANYPTMTVKINGRLDLDRQLFALETAQKLGLSTSVLDDQTSQSPYGLVIHTDKAENCPVIAVEQALSDLWQTKIEPPANQKKGFWQKLFGK